MQQTNSCFASLKAIWDRDLQTILHPPLPPTYIELSWSVKDLQKNALKVLGTRSPVNILASDKFPALIDNPNNFEIVRLARLVVSRMFLLPSSASLIFFLHFDLIPLKCTPFWNRDLLQRPPCFGPVSVRIKQFLLQLRINCSISATKQLFNVKSLKSLWCLSR